MATKSPKEIAAEVFKNNPKAIEVFVCDGYAFLNDNAAELHATTSNSKKKLEVVKVLNPNNTASDDTNQDKNNDESKEKVLDRMNKTELQQKAASLGVDFEDFDTKKVLIEKINEVLNAKAE